MFKGNIPAPLQAMLNQTAATWPVQDMYIGCSGNFTIERVLHTHQRFRLHSNDVSIYTSALGAYFAGNPFRLELQPAAAERFGWLADYLGSPAEKAATILLGSRLIESLDKDGQPKNSPYYQRILKGLVNQWPDLHARTLDKLAATNLSVTSYSPEDVITWIKRVPRGAGFVSFPPFYTGGYETMFGKLEALFDWDKPTYTEISDGDLDGFFADMTDRPYWAFGTNHRWEDYDEFYRGMSHTSNRNVPIYLYASAGPHRVVVPKQNTKPVLLPRLGPDDEIGQTLTIRKLESAQFAALRSQYMDVHIAPATESLAMGVLVDGQLIGCFAFSVSTGNPFAGLSTIYLLSDFAVYPTRYRRLSKLILYAALSRESKLVAENLASRRIRQAFTTAFTDKPVSMKYRGLFDLVSRKENPDPADPHHYMINYQADMGQWSLAEGMKEWTQKHASK